MGFASAEISASHCHRSRFELLQVSSDELWTVSTKKLCHCHLKLRRDSAEKMWFKRFWVLMLSCRATLNFLPFCVTGWVLVSVKVLGWFIKHLLLVFPCSIIWPCLCSIMELAAILISEAGLWLPTCFSAACSVSSAMSLGLRIFRNSPTFLNQSEFKRCWCLMLLCCAPLNFLPFCAKAEAWLVSFLVRVFYRYGRPTLIVWTSTNQVGRTAYQRYAVCW